MKSALLVDSSSFKYVKFSNASDSVLGIRSVKKLGTGRAREYGNSFTFVI